MFKLVVLSALLALAAAKPSHLIAPTVYAAPAAVSHQSRVDVVSSPAVVSTYAAAPVVSSYAAAPLVSAYGAAPVLSAYSAAPVISSYAAAPVVAHTPLALAPNTPANVIGANGVPLDTVDVVNARAAHYTAKALNAHGIYKRSAVLPLAYSSFGAPAAISYSSRVDIPSAHTVVAAPVISAYSAPAFSSYAAPVISSYAAPLALAPHTPANVIGANGVPLDTVEVVNARAAHYTAKVLNAHGIHKRSAVFPLAYSSVAAPAAISYSSRVDIPSARTIVAAPVVSAYSTPLLSAYSTPVVSAYHAPLLSARIY